MSDNINEDDTILTSTNKSVNLDDTTKTISTTSENIEDKLSKEFQSSFVLFHALDEAIETKARNENVENQENDQDFSPQHDNGGIQNFSDFMISGGEQLTWVEYREIWNNMLSTNNGKQPCLVSIWQDLKEHSNVNVDDDDIENGYHDNTAIARGIKDAYSIRLSNDNSELKFIVLSQTFLWLIVTLLAIFGHYSTNNNSKIGTFEEGRLGAILVEAISLFIIELIWETILSLIVLKFNIKINYTRKLGNLLKVPKYFAADFLPFYESTALSMFTSLAINQTLFCLLFYRRSRERIPFLSYVFLSQDRREDRPDTLTFQVTEDIMTFSIYFPFKIFVANYIGAPAIIFIPILINNVGDGLAEPIGVKFGKHKYSTTALYYKGKFWNGEFTRSYEGSSCVYLTTVFVVIAYYAVFTKIQFWLTVILLPFLMTIAEAKAPHTNDGPFLAFVGCTFLSIIFFLVP